MREVVEPLLPRSREMVRERNLARKPWATALTLHMQNLEGRETGDWARGRQRLRFPWGEETRSGMQH
eukprot:6186697-Prymnesium_polylepis.1